MSKVKAKLFDNGRSQPATGDVVLSSKPETWDEILALLEAIPKSEKKDSLKDRKDAPPQKRDLF
jgi:hypothetical protein